MSQAALKKYGDEHPTTRQAADPARVRGEKSPDGADAEQGQPTGILVIEDERLMRKTLEQVLRKRGFAVWAAADGGEGVELYRRFGERIALVLSDVQMPVLDGPRTLDALRQINPFVRCCFMTGDTRLSTLTGLLKRGALRVFPKPFSSVAEVAEELRELATRPWDFSAALELSGEEAAPPGNGAGASQPLEGPAAVGFLAWVFSPLIRSVAGLGLLGSGARKQRPGVSPPK